MVSLVLACKIQSDTADSGLVTASRVNEAYFPIHLGCGRKEGRLCRLWHMYSRYSRFEPLHDLDDEKYCSK